MPIQADYVKQGMNITASSLVTMLTLGTMGWFILQPLMISQISTAMAGEISDQIELKTRPISGAFKVLLQSDINRIKRNIARLEFREKHKPETWEDDDAQRLADYKIELDAFEDAIDDLG